MAFHDSEARNGLSSRSAHIELGGRTFQWGKRAYVMGIVNLTPDSFSGDGLGSEVDAAVTQALAMQEAGADIVDVGGESTRPPGLAYGAGADPVPVEVELARVMPVICRLAQELHIPISIDTYKAEVARHAVEAGATLINDVWALQRDPGMAQAVAETGAPVVLNHSRIGTQYRDLFAEVVADLQHSIDTALAAGVAHHQIIVDPGFGFGKNTVQNLELLRRLAEFKAALGYPLLVGTSRKSFIGQVLGGVPPQKRLAGTAATVAIAILQGADIVRVHDVETMVQVARMSSAVAHRWQPPVA